MWQTRQDSENADLAGKFLAVLPVKSQSDVAAKFFTRTPERQSALALQTLTSRGLPN
jgi:hypothetical protein